MSSADQQWIADAIAAVLARNPDAVARARAALDDLRDRATTALNFERAGRIQAESDALDWIISPQRVTTAAGDTDVYGWSAGVLVHLAIRAGRLSAWSQSTCSESRASEKLAATPAIWAAFAQRNASLASALAAA